MCDIVVRCLVSACSEAVIFLNNIPVCLLSEFTYGMRYNTKQAVLTREYTLDFQEMTDPQNLDLSLSDVYGIIPTHDFLFLDRIDKMYHMLYIPRSLLKRLSWNGRLSSKKKTPRSFFKSYLQSLVNLPSHADRYERYNQLVLATSGAGKTTFIDTYGIGCEVDDMVVWPDGPVRQWSESQIKDVQHRVFNVLSARNWKGIAFSAPPGVEDLYKLPSYFSGDGKDGLSVVVIPEAQLAFNLSQRQSNKPGIDMFESCCFCQRILTDFANANGIAIYESFEAFGTARAKPNVKMSDELSIAYEAFTGNMIPVNHYVGGAEMIALLKRGCFSEMVNAKKLIELVSLGIDKEADPMKVRYDEVTALFCRIAIETMLLDSTLEIAKFRSYVASYYFQAWERMQSNESV